MKSFIAYIKGEEFSLLNSILFLIFGIILFTNPGGILRFVSYIAGGIVLLIGLYNILGYYRTLKKLNIEKDSLLISGIILVIFSVIIAFSFTFIEAIVRLVCGGWIIYNGVIKLMQAFVLKPDKKRFYISLALSILMIICGFYVAITTNLVFSMIGLFIMIYEIIEIANYIIYSKKTSVN